jgi:molybdopterin guanine dinucleotide-containing S/N-oxide reductase-like protein
MSSYWKNGLSYTRERFLKWLSYVYPKCYFLINVVEREKLNMLEAYDKVKDYKPEKTVFKALGLGGITSGGAPCAIDSKDGKIVRIRPLHYDWKYDPKKFNPWKIRKGGKTLEPLMKSAPSPFSLAYKKRAYSPNRIKYPLKRVDWDPQGERNAQNRGKSKYQRISWDEAAEIVASELNRVQEKYGPYAVLAQVDGHGECKTVHSAHGCPTLLLEKMGGYTQQVRNPDSWEGWYWGSKHVWGNGWVGMMDPVDNIMQDMTSNCEMVIFWSGDPETTPWGFTGQSATRICYFWRDIGIKQVYICPDLNYGAAVHADKWIPILPNTDAALQLAIIYTWITEGTYDKEYVNTHTVGFDKVTDYVLGKEDGVAKTPAWAAPKCGVPEWTIKALAREFAVKTTSIAHYLGGSMIRGPYSHEPARLEVILLGMQGLGKPGVHQCQVTRGMPRGDVPGFNRLIMERIRGGVAALGRLQKPGYHTLMLFTKQHIPKTLIQEAILNPPVTYWGHGAIGAVTEDQFVKYTYPLPKEEGGTEIHMIWTDTPCRTTCWNDGNKTIEALRSPKIECIVAQHPWLENDTLMADIILPSNTTLEEEDIVSNLRTGEDFQIIGLQRQAMEPVGESKSDYEVVLEIAKKLGKYEEVTEGKTVQDWIKVFFDEMGLETSISWEEFKEKGYYIIPIVKDWEKDPAGLIKFYQDPVKNPLPTPSGKLEFYSERLANYFPEDKERPPLPKWIEKGITHDERLSSDRARVFPLLLMSNHGRWRVHAQCDDISWTREAPTCKVRGWDGYLYEPLWIHPSTAEKRGIRDGDIVKAFNERGAVLCGARVWERIMPGVVYVDHGARCDWIIPGKLDRGGAINLISPQGTVSKNCVGQATSGYLVEVERVSMAQMEEWQKQYPEAFKREYNPASGLRFNAWIEGDSN